MKKSSLLFIIVIFTFGCKKRLDSFLFNPNTEITSYQLDNYTGTTSIPVGSEYAIPADKIHTFQFPISDEGKTLMISAIYVGELSEIATDTVMMYCHGNSQHMDFYWPRQKLYANLGSKNRFGVLMIDYPGFGLSEGTPTEQNMYTSVRGALNWLHTNGLTSDRLVMMGFSLGSAPVCEITANSSGNTINPSKIILEAPFASAEVLVQSSAGIAIPSSYFTSLKIDNAEEIKKIQQPFLWIHGEADGFLAIDKHGEPVFNNYQGSFKKSVRVPGGDHENTPSVFGYSNYLSEILQFIEN